MSCSKQEVRESMSSPHSRLPDFDSLWNYEQPAETEVAFLAVLEQIEAQQPEVPPEYRLELLTQIARAQALQRRFEDAQATLDRVETELKSMPLAESEPVTPRLRYLLERGRVFNLAGEPKRARPLFLRAWETATASGQDGYAVDAAHMLGIVEPAKPGQEWNHMALVLARASHDPHATRWRGSLYDNMGWTYHKVGDYNQALTMFEQAQNAWQTDGQVDRVPIATWAVARTLRSLGRVDEALAIQMALQAEYELASDAGVPEEIGECLLLLGREEEARPYFARAWSMMSQYAFFAKAEPERMERLHTLAMVGKEKK